MVAGTIDDRVTRRGAARMDGYLLLEGDFHVHGFFGDCALEPWSLLRTADRANLDVIAVTNHNQVFAGQVVRSVARRVGGPLVIGGEEITGRTFHLIAVGIERTVSWDQPAVDAIAAVQAQGGVAIAAHPTRAFWQGWDDRALQMLDGLEAAHPDVFRGTGRQDLETFFRRARTLNPGVAAIGSSDFHSMAPIGLCRTYLFAREYSQAGVLEAVRQGRTVASDRDGRLYGDPDLVKQVAAYRATRNDRTRSDVVSRLAVAGALLGLFGMVVFGRRP